jgi:hypothetical protein
MCSLVGNLTIDNFFFKKKKKNTCINRVLLGYIPKYSANSYHTMVLVLFSSSNAENTFSAAIVFAGRLKVVSFVNL